VLASSAFTAPGCAHDESICDTDGHTYRFLPAKPDDPARRTPRQAAVAGTRHILVATTPGKLDAVTIRHLPTVAAGLQPGRRQWPFQRHIPLRLSAGAVLRNIRPKACTIPILPQPGFTTADGRLLEFIAQTATAPHVGSTPPRLLGSGACATSDRRWVSCNVYDNGHGESPAFISLARGGQTVTSNFYGHLFGPGGKPPAYTLTAFGPSQHPLRLPRRKY
jgi:hypothetical protein